MSLLLSSLLARRSGWQRFRATLPALCCASLTWAQDPAPTRPASARGYLGVTLTEICPEVRAQTTLKEGEGLMIGRVAPESPASAFGLLHYDILTRFNDQWIMSPAQFITLVENARPGSEVEITFLRRGSMTRTKVILAAPPVTPPAANLPPLPEEMLTSVIRLLRDNPVELETVHRMLHSSRGGIEGVESSLKHGSRVTLHDDSGEVEITKFDASHQVRAWDAAGQLIFEGPCNTDAEKEAIPKTLRARVERLLEECDATHARPRLRIPDKVSEPQDANEN